MYAQVGEAHRRTKAVAAALEVVQGQLAEEERRSSTLTSTLSKLNCLQYAKFGRLQLFCT
jgi:hypothetical protein